MKEALRKKLLQARLLVDARNHKHTYLRYLLIRLHIVTDGKQQLDTLGERQSVHLIMQKLNMKTIITHEDLSHTDRFSDNADELAIQAIKLIEEYIGYCKAFQQRTQTLAQVETQQKISKRNNQVKRSQSLLKRLRDQRHSSYPLTQALFNRITNTQPTTGAAEELDEPSTKVFDHSPMRLSDLDRLLVRQAGPNAANSPLKHTTIACKRTSRKKPSAMRKSLRLIQKKSTP